MSLLLFGDHRNKNSAGLFYQPLRDYVTLGIWMNASQTCTQTKSSLKAMLNFNYRGWQVCLLSI